MREYMTFLYRGDEAMPRRTDVRLRHILQQERGDGVMNNDIELDTEFNNDQPDDQANDQAYDQPDDQPDDQRMLEEFSSSDSEMQIDQNMEEEDNVSTNADDDNLHEHFWCDDLLYTSTDTLFDFEKIDNFEDLLKCRELHEKINVPTDISRGELLLMLLKFSIRNELSMSAMTNLFQLVNTIYKRPVLFNSRHMLDKFFNVKDQLQYQIICYECSSDLGTDRLEKITCSICNAENDKNNQEKSAYFVLLNPAEQIRDLLMQNLEYFTYVTQQRPHEFSHLSDVYDGIKYREFLSSLTPEEKKNYVTAVFNTDGASKFKCSQQSAWPLYLMINELPKHIRTKHLVICGIFFGPKKPDMLIFIDKFIDLIKNVTIPCTINNEERLIKMYILTCCVDAVARAPIQGIKQFNDNYGCNWCLHPGVTHGVKRFPILSETPRLREHNEMVELMMEADPDNPKLGVMYPSPLLNLPKFDLVDGFIPDYLHMALEGVAKQFANYHLDKLDDVSVKKLNKKMLSISVPQQVSRYTRKISQRKHWKAREWENFTLYYSPVIFFPLLSRDEYEHWLLFVESLYILLLDKINVKDLDKADEMLHRFNLEIIRLYDVRMMTYNVHQLLHVCRSVLHWGPVWSNSTFCFESANHYVLKSIKCAKGASEQVMRYVHMNHKILVLEEKIYKTAKDDVVRYCTDILTCRLQCVNESEDILYFTPLSDENIISNYFRDDSNQSKYLKIVKNNCLYESYLLNKKRSNNSFAILDNGLYVRLVAFAICSNDNDITYVNIVQTETFSENYKYFLKIKKVNENILTIPTNVIKKVCVNINVDGNYIIPVPNLLHY
ncbi:hypothetical protein TKK_0012422 [Trichogramma kaykai]